ncbi:RNA-directed RNA polymerase L [Ceratobasidium sp. AG-Ba]|nr:RNA-directed RNA polymerase L [Ceratobasidium sp. AG-Ba]QRW07134.1 RNA-directed RNA polymerase L [Ceratobasidium sp. AG-Ba]
MHGPPALRKPQLLASNRASYIVSPHARRAGITRTRFPEIYKTWYRGKENFKIDRLQHRKEFAPPYHECILLLLDDNSKYRFDRRIDPEQIADALVYTSPDAYDTIESVDDIEKHPHSASRCIAELGLNGHVDIGWILNICHGIQKSKQARPYSLPVFNCYFFSWTIVCLVARRLVVWESLPKIDDYNSTRNEAMSKYFVNHLLTQLDENLPASLFKELRASLSRTIPKHLPELLLKAARSD